MIQALLLTGAPGTGKTTIIRDAIHVTKESTGGFYTQEIREGRARLGFEIATLDGSRAVLAHVDFRGPLRVGKYGVDVACLERVAIPAMHRAIQAGSLVVVDEIGKMELLSPSFRDAVMEVLNSGRRLLGTAMLQPHPFAERVKRDPRVQVLLVSRSNHQAVIETLTTWLRS